MSDNKGTTHSTEPEHDPDVDLSELEKAQTV